MKQLSRTLIAPFLLALAILAGCVEESDTVVTFDQVLDNTTFTNRLLAPVVLYRNNEVLDTLPARTSRSYPIGRKGAFRHAWRLIAPLDRYGKKASIEPRIELGVQYALRGGYTITNEIPGEGLFGGRTIFAPMVANFSGRPLRLIANYREEDQVYTDYLIPSNIDSMMRHAPYFFWNESSNIRLESTIDSYYRFYSRDDTTDRQLKLDNSSEFDESGRTVPVIVN